jgi:hypothetical protein
MTPPKKPKGATPKISEIQKLWTKDKTRHDRRMAEAVRDMYPRLAGTMSEPPGDMPAELREQAGRAVLKHGDNLMRLLRHPHINGNGHVGSAITEAALRPNIDEHLRLLGDERMTPAIAGHIARGYIDRVREALQERGLTSEQIEKALDHENDIDFRNALRRN